MLFSKAMPKLDHMVIKMFESYGVENYSDSHIESSTYLLRYLKYRAPEMNETTMAFPSHTDKSFLTILHQNQVSGLEIKSRDNEWISVEFSPSSFVIMAGDACQAWSNGRIYAPVHHVAMRTSGAVRYSLGLFSFMKSTVEVPKVLVVGDEQHIHLRFRP